MKWLARLPHPYTSGDRAAGYRYDLSMLQAEFPLTQMLDKPVSGRTPAGRAGARRCASRVIGLHDPSANGRRGKPLAFGYKAQIVDHADGVILDHTIEIGNPPDAPQLAPAIQRITPAQNAALSPPTAAAANATAQTWRGHGVIHNLVKIGRPRSLKHDVRPHRGPSTEHRSASQRPIPRHRRR